MAVMLMILVWNFCVGPVVSRCPPRCLTCANATFCLSCETGYWGGGCQKNCSGCIDACDITNGACLIGCPDGYFQVSKDGPHVCEMCPYDCEICIDESTCLVCKTGFYQKVTGKCVKCSENCNNGKCNLYNGTCIGGCINQWLGDFCNASCPSNCLECEMEDALTCLRCKPEYYGIDCQMNCSSHCNRTGDIDTCNRINGSCKHGCTDGYWGSDCELPCMEGCKGRICNGTSGKCFKGCKSTYYGENCESMCHKKCKSDSLTFRKCDASLGVCLWGCQDKYYGIFCTEECRNCRNGVCFQFNGTCKDGCVPGFSGQNCRQIEGSQTYRIQGSPTNSAVTGLSVGIVITTIIAIIAIAGHVIQWIRRRKNLNTAPSCSGGMTANTESRSDYQDLKNFPSEEKTYSDLIHEYENSI